MTTAEKIKVMQAYVDGKQIQATPKKCDMWAICLNEPAWDWYKDDYRIAPEEPHYRPYKDTEEMIADFMIRFNFVEPSFSLPLIWIKNSEIKSDCSLITDYFMTGVRIGDGNFTFKELLDEYEYLDGSPIGKLVEE